MGNSAPDTTRTAPRGAGLFLFLFLFCLYALTMRGVPTGGDAFGMFLVTQSIAEDGDVYLEPDNRVVLVEGRDGRTVSKFGLGQSLAEVPAYIVGRALAARNKSMDDTSLEYFVTAFTGPLLGALACVFVFAAGMRLGNSLRVSLGVALAAGVCSLLWPHSRLLFSEPLQAMALAAALLYGIDARERGGAPVSAAAGFFPGLLVAAKPALALVCVPFVIYFLSGLNKQKNSGKALDTAAFFAALGFWACVVLGYNYVRFGGFFDTGYMTLHDRESLHGFNVPLLYGLHGLLFSSGKGLLFYTPAVVLSCAALPMFMKRRKAEGWLILTIFAVFLLTFAKWNQWHGDYAWGPRFLVPVAPLLLIPMGELFAPEGLFRRAWFRVAFVIVMAASLFVQVLGSFVNYNEYLIITKHQIPYDISMDAADPGRIDLRDNMLNPHYIPEFSPLAGHWWILKHTMKDRKLPKEELNAAMQEDFPWRSLMPYAPPQDPARAVMFDCWWYYIGYYYAEGRWWRRGLIYLSLILGAFSAIMLIYYLRKRAEQ